MKKELLKGFSNEQIAKLKKCKNTEEILALAKAEGVELTSEQLEAVSGGGSTFICETVLKTYCPQCDSGDVEEREHGWWHCNHCGLDFEDELC